MNISTVNFLHASFFQDLLCDIEIWHEAPGELLRSHLEHLYELAAESNEKKCNTFIMRDLQLVHRFLYIMPEIKHPTTRHILFSLLSILLNGQPRQIDILYFGQFIASTLPIENSEKHFKLSDEECELDNEVEIIQLRNRCLALLHTLVFSSRNHISEEIVKTLGFDWLLLFLQPHIHSSTVIWAFRILVAVCSIPSLSMR